MCEGKIDSDTNNNSAFVATGHKNDPQKLNEMNVGEIKRIQSWCKRDENHISVDDKYQSTQG